MYSCIPLSASADHHLYYFVHAYSADTRHLHAFPTRRSSDLNQLARRITGRNHSTRTNALHEGNTDPRGPSVTLKAEATQARSEEHTSELQSLRHLVCRLLLENKKQTRAILTHEKLNKYSITC